MEEVVIAVQSSTPLGVLRVLLKRWVSARRGGDYYKILRRYYRVHSDPEEAEWTWESYTGSHLAWPRGDKLRNKQTERPTQGKHIVRILLIASVLRELLSIHNVSLISRYCSKFPAYDKGKLPTDSWVALVHSMETSGKQSGFNMNSALGFELEQI